MPRYLCPKCQGVFCGWAVRYKLKNRCPNCGSRLKEIHSNNKKYRKAIRDKRVSMLLAI